MDAGDHFYPDEDGEIDASTEAQYAGDEAGGGAGPGAGGGASSKDEEIEEMRRRLQEMEEADTLAASREESSTAAISEEKAEVDARSIYVGNVDYACLPEEVQQHFQSCGAVNRVTILSDKFGQPKGFAYVEFVEADAVQNALLLNETELHGRPLKVCTKRTNVPGMKQSRGRRPFRGRLFVPPPFHAPHGYGKAPRIRRPPRFRPYY